MKGKWKQNSKKKKGNVVLQKYIVAMDEFIKSEGGSGEGEQDHGLKFVKKKSRKELRREKRKMKKAKMKSHYEGKKNLASPLDEGENSGIPGDEEQKKKKKKTEKEKKEVSKAPSNKSSSAPTDKSNNSKTPSSSKKGKKINKLQESRKMALLEANEDEDREIKKLERQLGLNKRKNKKSLPQSFVADGLDYILGVLDSGSSAVGMYDDDDDNVDVAKENFEKLDEKDSQLSDEEPGDEMASEGSDEEMGSFDDENEVDDDDEEDDDDDDEMVDEEEAEEEAEEEEMEDELNENNAADSDDETEGEAEEEADTPDTNTSDSKSETVSS